MKKYEKYFALIILGLILFSLAYFLDYIRTLKVSVVIVPHHDFVATERDEFFKKIPNDYRTIILISPNHFNSGTSNIITTDKMWKLSDGEILADTKTIARLENLGIENDEGAFSREHGITNILENIHQSFPKSSLVPIILKQSLSKEETKEFANKLISSCSEKCLLITSVDFSHYQFGSLAEVHDNFSIKALSNLDEDQIWKTEVDSKQALLMSVIWAKHFNTNNFSLEENTNSSKIADQPNTESTSYIFGWFQKGEKVKNTTTAFINFRSLDKNKLSKDLGERFVEGAEIENLDLKKIIEEKDFEILEKYPDCVIAGTINVNALRLTFLPIKFVDGKYELLRGDERFSYIKNIKNDFGDRIYNNVYGYDIIKLIIST